MARRQEESKREPALPHSGAELHSRHAVARRRFFPRLLGPAGGGGVAGLRASRQHHQWTVSTVKNLATHPSQRLPPWAGGSSEGPPKYPLQSAIRHCIRCSLFSSYINISRASRLMAASLPGASSSYPAWCCYTCNERDLMQQVHPEHQPILLPDPAHRAGTPDPQTPAAASRQCFFALPLLAGGWVSAIFRPVELRIPTARSPNDCKRHLTHREASTVAHANGAQCKHIAQASSWNFSVCAHTYSMHSGLVIK